MLRRIHLHGGETSLESVPGELRRALKLWTGDSVQYDQLKPGIGRESFNCQLGGWKKMRLGLSCDAESVRSRLHSIWIKNSTDEAAISCDTGRYNLTEMCWCLVSSEQ